VHSYFEENGTAYFVMDFIEGTSFDVYIKEHGGRVSYEEAEKILLPVMDALAAVHSKGIVHRDVTPDNIYITKDGTVKLLDFGAARYSLGDKSRSLDVVLKHGFAPKEQYTRHGKQGPFTDVYSLGATFYFAITGRRPPDSIDRLEEDDLVPPSSLGVQIPPEKEDALIKAMSVQPADRYPND
jgi:serine/threonine protein kinase